MNDLHDVEVAILSTCMLDDENEAIQKCVEHRVVDTVFTEKTHRILWNVIITTYEKTGFVDVIVISDTLSKVGLLDQMGGYAGINKILTTFDMAMTHRMDEWLGILTEANAIEQIRKMCLEAVGKCENTENPSSGIIGDMNARMMALAMPKGRTLRKMNEIIGPAMENLRELREKGGNLMGITSGLIDVDKMTMGFRPQEVTVIAARPSVGKTSLALKIAEANILPRYGEPTGVLFFSIEMSSAALSLRMAFTRARVSRYRWFEKTANKQQEADVEKARDEIEQAPMWVEERSDINSTDIRLTSRHIAAREKNLGLIIVDYLQLADSIESVKIREQVVAGLSRNMKAMAKELNLPVVVLSQLNRELTASGRKPRLSDIRESGSIEQDADVVLLLSETEDDCKRLCDVAKHRDGETGEIDLTWTKHLALFDNYIGENRLC